MATYTKEQLSKLLNIAVDTLYVYLSRAEFSHIKRERINKILHYKNVTDNDIEALKRLFNRKANKKWKKKINIQQEINIS